jgi:hypothetical protein
MLKLYDILWAPTGIDISDVRLIRLLNSSAVKRLLNVGQNGAANYFEDPLGKKFSTTRYEHSVGAMILTLQIGGTIEEAIVALLHDVMHTAFSHTVDHLSEDPSESFHEIHKHRLLEKFKDEFIEILGPNWMLYFNEKAFPLIKKNNPFAIDVADYTARDCTKYGICQPTEVYEQLQNLTIDARTRQLCCLTEESRKWWEKMSKIINDNMYNSSWNMAINYIFAQEIKKLIAKEIITFEILLESDDKTEGEIYNLVKDNVERYMKNKKFLLLKVDSYDDTQYTKIVTTKMRQRYVLPPIITKENPMTISSQIKKYEMDLVFYLE